GEIRRYLRDNNSIRVSRSLRDTAYKVLQAKEAYIAKHQKEPSMDEIATILEIRPRDVMMALDAIADPMSLDEPIYSDSGDAICMVDQVRDPKNTDESWLEQIALKEAIARLSERERHILALRFFQGRTQMEVSNEIGISQAQVSRLEKNALSQIKKEL
ncbi:MAG: sigma-70 family RNA polymerase sigma factor, partial [Eubacteriales bacterium]